MEERILIVDDEEVICNIIAHRLRKEGYLCETANNGKQGLNLFYRETFSLIISDIKMPEMNGIELLKKVKSIYPKARFIILTAYPDIGLAVDAIRLGANDFIIKPADLELVVFSVKRVLEAKRLEDEIENYHNLLEELVEERTKKLKQAYQYLKRSYKDSVKVLVEAIDAKDPYTRGHSDRVKRMSLGIARKMGFSDEQLEIIEYGALLHDIGKIGIKDEILQKQGSLSAEEYQIIQDHPLIGVKIVEGVDFFKDKIPMIRNHHEHYDGSGYPDGLKGDEIPLGARIIMVPDAFDAMTSLRPHRSIMPLEDVIFELERCKGKQFDPEVVEIFLKEKIYKS